MPHMQRPELRGWKERALSELGTASDPGYFRARATVYWRVEDVLGMFAIAPQMPEDLELSGDVFRAIRTPFRILADARRFRPAGSPGEIFHMLLRNGRALAEQIARVNRSVVVAPSDWTAVWWHGAATTLEWASIHPTVAHSMDEAWSLLDAPPGLAAEVAALTSVMSPGRDVAQRAERHLQETPTLGLADLARRLGVSTRALQRELAAEGDSFAALRARARLQRATELLRSSDEKISAIARAIGFRSRAHFGAWFRARTGRAPGELRTEPPSID